MKRPRFQNTIGIVLLLNSEHINEFTFVMDYLQIKLLSNVMEYDLIHSIETRINYSNKIIVVNIFCIFCSVQGLCAPISIQFIFITPLIQ